MKTVSDRTAPSICLEQDSKIKVSAGKQQYHASIEKGESERRHHTRIEQDSKHGSTNTSLSRVAEPSDQALTG
jgi:hypothetical protein